MHVACVHTCHVTQEATCIPGCIWTAGAELRAGVPLPRLRQPAHVHGQWPADASVWEHTSIQHSSVSLACHEHGVHACTCMHGVDIYVVLTYMHFRKGGSWRCWNSLFSAIAVWLLGVNISIGWWGSWSSLLVAYFELYIACRLLWVAVSSGVWQWWRVSAVWLVPCPTNWISHWHHSSRKISLPSWGVGTGLWQRTLLQG